jgi:hypothetical protein
VLSSVRGAALSLQSYHFHRGSLRDGLPLFYWVKLGSNIEEVALDSISASEAGRLGGLALLRGKGREYFVELGKKGQIELKKRYPGMASEWGKKGGRPKKQNI